MQIFYRLLKLDHSGFQPQQDLSSALSIKMASGIFFLIHAFFLAYFFFAGVYTMMAINFASVLFYTASFLLCRRHRDLASLFIVLEIAIYCVLSTYFIGWDVGTQNFLPVMIFPCYLMFGISRKRATLYTSILSVSMILCYWIDRVAIPVYFDRDFTVIMIANTIFCMSCAALLVLLLEYTNKFTKEYYMNRIENLTGEANKDALTQMWNRRYIEKRFARNYSDEGICECAYISIIDIDFFKKVNDTFGHTVGDAVLIFLANSIRDSFRRTDIAARWGGEEFLVILNNTDDTGALYALESFRKKIESSFIQVGEHSLRITVTIGFSYCMDSDTFTECVHKSDAALYYGKRNGRNKVVSYRQIKDLTHN